MSKKLSILFLALISLSFFSLQIIEEDRDKSLIYWDDRPLTWKDFKGKTPKNTEYVAMTHSAIDMLYGGENNNLRFIIETVFYPKSSWQKKKLVNDHILKHEQGHFDLTEYYSRLLRKDIAAIEFKKVSTIDAQVTKLFNKYSNQAEKMQDKYDKETNHSIDKEEQAKWNEKIAGFLEETKEYTETVIDLDISYLFN